MLGNRKDPELMSPSPEFIKVAYDERGRPIEVTPVNDIDSVQKKEQSTPQVTVQKPVIVKSPEQEAMVRWIVNLNDNLKILRDELRLVVVFNQRKFNELQTVVSNLLEKASFKPSAEILERFAFINNEISNLRNQNRLMLENFQAIHAELRDMTEKVESSGVFEKSVLDQLNSFELRMSTFAKEIASTKLYEIEISGVLKSLVEEIKNSNLSNLETVERLNSIEDELKKLQNEVISTNNYAENIASNVNQKMNEVSSLKDEIGRKINSLTLNQEESFTKINEIDEKINNFSRIDEELDSLKRQTADKLSENQNQMKADLLVTQEQIANSVNNRFLKIEKMLNKPKKRVVIKPTKSKVVRFLKKNFKIKSFSKVLVITDKRNSVFGKILYEATRSLSQKSVLAIMEDRTNKMNLDRHVIEAIKQSNYVFIVGNYSLKKVKDLAKTLRRKVKVMPIKRSLKFSIL